jgi:multidrug efflux pump subunit AcrA (membrane-fusion protein)
VRAGIALALLAAPIAAACGTVAGGGSVAVEARRAEMEVRVPALGTLEAVKESPIAVPRVPTGALKVKELIPEGTIVREGDVVVVFDETQLNIELDNHRAAFRSASRKIDRNGIQSTIEKGGIDVMKGVAALERENATEFALLDTEIFSRQEILDSQVKQDVAEETIVFADASLLLRGQYYDIEERILGVEAGQAKEKMGRAETSLGSLVLRAPLPGLVVYRKDWRGGIVSVGDSLWPGNVMMAIVDPTRTVLSGFVLEKDASGLEMGAAATVTVDAWPSRRFEGKVSYRSELSRPIQEGSPVKYFEVKVEILNGDPSLLKPGLKGEARILTGKFAGSIVIPRSALRGSAEEPFVLVDASAGPERRPVKTGAGDLVRVSITTGLSEGERVLLGNAAEPAPAAATGA